MELIVEYGSSFLSGLPSISSSYLWNRFAANGLSITSRTNKILSAAFFLSPVDTSMIAPPTFVNTMGYLPVRE